jgi:hypothetical protein
MSASLVEYILREVVRESAIRHGGGSLPPQQSRQQQTPRGA